MVAGYLLDLCHRFSTFYNKCRILGEPPELESARMTLVLAVQRVLKEGLGVLGMDLPDAM
jgi:arginyl-tRNA synthetase